MSGANVITNENGELRSAVGPQAVEAFRLRTLIVGLKFEAKHPGMKLSRVNLKKAAKQITGLRTNDVTKLVDALAVKLDAAIAQCEVKTLVIDQRVMPEGLALLDR